ncbi:MAG: acyl carrier protein [Candidatus Omnitrophota bacterium]
MSKGSTSKEGTKTPKAAAKKKTTKVKGKKKAVPVQVKKKVKGKKKTAPMMAKKKAAKKNTVKRSVKKNVTKKETKVKGKKKGASIPVKYLNKKEVEKKIRAIIAEVLEIDEKKITRKTRFFEDLGMDSMMALEILAMIEKEFKVEIKEEDLPKIVSYDGAIKLTMDLFNKRTKK